MAEWSIAAVLKTVDLKGSGGSNPSLSAKRSKLAEKLAFFLTGKHAFALATNNQSIVWFKIVYLSFRLHHTPRFPRVSVLPLLHLSYISLSPLYPLNIPSISSTYIVLILHEFIGRG